MKRTLGLLVMLFVVGTFAAQGQQGGPRLSVEERVKQIMEKVTPALSLDKSQATLTDSAFTNFYRGMEKLRAGMQSGTRPDRTQFEALSTERDEKLKKILSADQYKKFKEEVEPTMQRRQGGQGLGRPSSGDKLPTKK